MIIMVTSLPFKNIPAVPLPCTTNAKREQRKTHIVLRFIQKCICKTICKINVLSRGDRTYYLLYLNVIML